MQSYCRTCRKAINNESYHRTKEKHNPKRRENVQRRILKNQRYVLDYLLSHPCIDCGERDPVVLQFDHQRDKVKDISYLTRAASVPTIAAEIEKCEVVCANCHTRRTASQFGWYRASMNCESGSPDHTPP
ncbi:hypothetical protein SEA_JONJAMES_21 [Gordonia Phage JonJames]|nr:hypothetical protein SEA_JONJAMES_21 [Gordonia Phage JonJames]